MNSDIILDVLRQQPAPLGSLAKAFPGQSAVAESTHWLDDWFVEQATAFLGPKPPSGGIKSSAAIPEVLLPLRKPPATGKVRLKSIQPHYFRGFRGQAEPVTLDADLIVVEGRNSSGKTSLAEAFEWLFTGQLSRRSSGHARELAKCIGNEFRPQGETTWVESVVLLDDRAIKLRRVLTEDYSDRQNSATSSDLLVDDKRVSPTAANKLLDRLFAGVAPIMMQHTLSQFIHDTPDNRRRYFERLLQLDELTTLIEKAVIGDARAAEFRPAVGAISHARWRLLCDSVSPASKSIVDRFERKADAPTRSAVEQTLVSIGNAEFQAAAQEGSNFRSVFAYLHAEHSRDRERRFPFLNALRPRAGTGKFVAGVDTLTTSADGVEAALLEVARAEGAIREISAAELAISRAVELLVDAGLIDSAQAAPATCPVCDYRKVPTLSARRVATLRTRLPLASALDRAAERYRGAVSSIATQIRSIRAEAKKVLIGVMNETDLKAQIGQLDPAIVIGIAALQSSARAIGACEGALDGALITAEQSASDRSRSSELLAALRSASASLAQMRHLLGQHAAHFAEVEKNLGVVALDNPTYALREKWLDAAGDLDGVIQAIGWEAAKTKAQHLLKKLREGLIQLRTAVIEAAREDFSEKMTEVWLALREDTASTFSQLHIPEVKGKGYKLEMEVKARISDGVEDIEVDALKVFSESQVNVVGLAACITRARLLGHSVLIFDDPVQSMDEEHYLSFAGLLMQTLLDQGFQVLILTHSDQFCRDVADAHHRRESFLTLRSRATRRHGAVIEEGNRRVAERLRSADDLAENGKLDLGWTRVRLALERMFLLAYARQMPNFDTRSWRLQTGEAMWNAGAAAVIESAVPESGERLKAILRLTAAGAHDGAPRGVKDLKEATRYIRSLLGPLQIGDG